MSEAYRVDLNADVGEGADAEPDVLDVVTSANVACGLHAGDRRTMERTLCAAAARGVAVGAHPSYPDREGFGRRSIPIAPAEIEALVLEQINALSDVARACGVALSHVKPHGALYNDAAGDRPLADAIAAASRRAGGLRLFGLAGSVMADAARAAGIAFAAEGFCDRRYDDAGRLVSRSIEGSVIEDPNAAAAQALALVRAGRVKTLCIHGDTNGAAGLAKVVRATLESAGVRVAALE